MFSSQAVPGKAQCFAAINSSNVRMFVPLLTLLQRSTLLHKINAADLACRPLLYLQKLDRNLSHRAPPFHTSNTAAQEQPLLSAHTIGVSVPHLVRCLQSPRSGVRHLHWKSVSLSANNDYLHTNKQSTRFQRKIEPHFSAVGVFAAAAAIALHQSVAMCDCNWSSSALRSGRRRWESNTTWLCKRRATLAVATVAGCAA